jgi:arylsulfatase A-like enzyme
MLRWPCLALALVLALGSCGGERARPGTPPRHVLLLTCAGMRADHMSAYMYPRMTTRIEAFPEQRERGENLALDDLAEQGVLFWSAYSPRAADLPALASLLTGRAPLELDGLDASGAPSKLGVLGDDGALADRVDTLAERFARNGFRTAAFVANAELTLDKGLAQGFAHYWVAEAAEADPDYAIVKQATAWMHTQGPDDPRPLFVWMHFTGPRAPWEPAPLGSVDYAKLFADPDATTNANGSRAWIDAAQAPGAAPESRPSALDLERVVALYDGELARVSWLVRLFLQLWAGKFADQQPRDLLKDSVLVFAGTYGQELYQRNHWLEAERSVWSSSLRVPLVLRHPGSLTGARVLDTAVELADVAPTLLDWFELDGRPTDAGRSLLALTDAPPRTRWLERPVVGTWRDAIRTATDGRYRLVSNPSGADPSGDGSCAVPALALYDLERDSLERNDVSAAHPDVVARLRAALEPVD